MATKLEVYYCINKREGHDYTLIEKCLRLHISVNLKEYELIKYDEIPIGDFCEDEVKNGLNMFNEMYKSLKLKTKNNVWFIYLANGNVDIYKNIFV